MRDEEGALAVFQELSAHPTTIQDANANVAYGTLPGHDTEAADAVRAYIQSLLKSKYKTWARIPPELWPKEWKGKYQKPMCLLVKALYGHPESGGHWEQHLTTTINDIGGQAITNHPSSFWFPETKMLLTVYVDDLLLSGPKGQHKQVWEALRKTIKLEDPEQLSRFLGRTHTVTRTH